MPEGRICGRPAPAGGYADGLCHALRRAGEDGCWRHRTGWGPPFAYAGTAAMTADDRAPALDAATLAQIATEAEALLPLESIEYSPTQDYLAHLIDGVRSLLAEAEAAPALRAEVQRLTSQAALTDASLLAEGLLAASADLHEAREALARVEALGPALAKAAYVAGWTDPEVGARAWEDMGGSEPSEERAAIEVSVQAVLDAALRPQQEQGDGPEHACTSLPPWTMATCAACRQQEQGS